ncbi:MAG: winged helix-turn-helix transcriptional regulator [Candidatus Thorarchaeota archaeon]|nr:winged helix-turn-helix transcriptional regulator [Candidatus Thorarchaeota archaeon]
MVSDDKLLKWQVEFHKALSNPIRLQIVEDLLEGEECQCEMFPRIGLTQSTVSAYLSQLVDAGILESRREGRRKLYSIASNDMADLIRKIRELVKSAKQ